MMFRRKKFISSLLILALVILPMRTVLATGIVGFSSNEADVVVEMEVDIAKQDATKCHQHNVSDKADSDHCQSSGQGNSPDKGCVNTGCEQCGICTLAVFSSPDLWHAAGHVEHAFFAYKGIYNHQVTPPFRPPQV